MAIPNYSGVKHFHDSGDTAGRGSGDIIYEGTTAGLTAGLIYYLDDDGEWVLADADSDSTSKQLLAVALGANVAEDGMLLRGMVTLDTSPGSSVGLPIYLSRDAGGASVTAPTNEGDIVRIVGYSINGAKVWFDPSPSYIELA